MFALIRHAGYQIRTGTITENGAQAILGLSRRLQSIPAIWKTVRVSPTTRTRETGLIISEELGIPLEINEQLITGGSVVSFIPPNEPEGVILVSHLPVITHLLIAWSRSFHQEEPPFTEVGTGYLIDPIAQTIQPITNL